MMLLILKKHNLQRIDFSLLISLLLLLTGGVISLASIPVLAQVTEKNTALQKGASGLPIPRFVSLKSDRVNLRQGPSKDHGIVWIYRRSGLPVEIIGEFEQWRRVRDAEGNDGWIYFSLLSGRRTVLIIPWSGKNLTASAEIENVTALHVSNSKSAKIIATLEAGVLANINECDGDWCSVSVNRFSGWIEQEKLWGVYRGEKVR